MIHDSEGPAKQEPSNWAPADIDLILSKTPRGLAGHIRITLPSKPMQFVA